MSIKGWIIVSMVVLLIVVVVFVQFISKPDVDFTNSTVLNMSEGNYRVSCDDAKWLLDMSIAMVQEKLAQLEGIDKPGEELSDEEYQQLQDTVFNQLTPSQIAMQEWYEAVMKGIRGLVPGDERKDEVNEIIANEYLQIYQTAMAIHLGLMPEDAVRAEIEANFCE